MEEPWLAVTVWGRDGWAEPSVQLTCRRLIPSGKNLWDPAQCKATNYFLSKELTSVPFPFPSLTERTLFILRIVWLWIQNFSKSCSISKLESRIISRFSAVYICD
jgi:hypothetical protein